LPRHLAPASAMSGQARSKSNSRGHYGIYLSAISWKYRGIVIGICCTPDFFDVASFFWAARNHLS
jgi:hypothetical protein